MRAADIAGDASSTTRERQAELQLDRLLAEFAHQRTATGDADLDALRTAILVEDTFGIVLSDEQLDPSVLGDPAALRALLDSSNRPA